MNSSIKFVVAMMAIAVLGFQSLHADGLEVARNAYMRDSSEAKTAGDMAVEAARQRDAARSEVARLETAGGTLTVREAYVAGLLRALELASAAVEARSEERRGGKEGR